MNNKQNKHLDQQAEGKGGIWNHGFSGEEKETEHRIRGYPILTAETKNPMDFHFRIRARRSHTQPPSCPENHVSNLNGEDISVSRGESRGEHFSLART
jgi:hypothetical protein